MGAAISTCGLTRIYESGGLRRRRVTALRDLSLEVREGEIVSILGPNGAGKTTLVKLLLGVIHPTSGSATLLGRVVGDPEARRLTGFLPEHHRFPPQLTGRQVLKYFGGMGGVREPELGRRADQLLEMVGLSAHARTAVRKYSKGMSQRLAYAQALMGDPRVLFLDEPTDGLDPEARRDMREHVKRFRDEGRTVLVNSHLLSEVELISDRVAILDKGELRRVGSLAEIVTPSEEYLIEVQCEGGAEALGRVHAGDWSAEGAHWRLVVTSRESRDTVVRALVAAGIGVESVTARRRSLEDSYLSMVAGEEAS